MLFGDNASGFFLQFVGNILQISTDVLSTGITEEEIRIVGLPPQRPSPIYAKVEGEKITLDEGVPAHPILRTNAISTTKSYLETEIEAIEHSLIKSNVDDRFRSAIKRLKDLMKFDDDAGAISLGLHARSVQLMLEAVENELADVLAVHISATVTSISSFVSQYRDWVEFTRNANNYPGRDAVDAVIDPAIMQLEDILTSNPDTIDERIPRSFAAINKLLLGSQSDRVNAIFAGVRGFENICIAAIRFSYDQAISILKESSSKARPSVVKITSVAIIATTIALISKFLPVIGVAPELRWISENLSKIEKLAHILRTTDH